jgi:hypothetical protein
MILYPLRQLEQIRSINKVVIIPVMQFKGQSFLLAARLAKKCINQVTKLREINLTPGKPKAFDNPLNPRIRIPFPQILPNLIFSHFAELLSFRPGIIHPLFAFFPLVDNLSEKEVF